MTPMEWLALLGERLVERRNRVYMWQRYFDGDHDLPNGPQQHQEAYRKFQRMARTNLCKLAVDSMVHRMQVVGYKTGETDDRADNEVWSLWQAARMDSRQFGLYRKALATGAAYIVVGVDPGNPRKPRVTIESAMNVVVATDPADPTQRLAAMRLWHDPYASRWMATLYLPGQRFGFVTKREHTDELSISMLNWTAKSWESRFEPQTSFDDVPVIEFSNGDEGGEPRAEFDVGIDVQNRINLTLLNRMTAERYAAFRQRFLMNYEPEYDEATGLPLSPFKSGADQLFVVPPPGPGMPEPRFGDLVQTDTANMLRAVEADMSAFASVTITPIYYLPGDLINISAEGIAALDAGHISKITERSLSWSERHEEWLQFAARIAGLERELTAAEVVWARPENTAPAVLADFASKLAAAGYPLPLIAEKLGDSPQQVERLKAELVSQAFRAALAQPPPLPGPTVASQEAGVG